MLSREVRLAATFSGVYFALYLIRDDHCGLNMSTATHRPSTATAPSCHRATTCWRSDPAAQYHCSRESQRSPSCRPANDIEPLVSSSQVRGRSATLLSLTDRLPERFKTCLPRVNLREIAWLIGYIPPNEQPIVFIPYMLCHFAAYWWFYQYRACAETSIGTFITPEKCKRYNVSFPRRRWGA